MKFSAFVEFETLVLWKISWNQTKQNKNNSHLMDAKLNFKLNQIFNIYT